MNKPVTIVFALLMSTTTVAEEKPSKEDTIAWLYERIAVIETPKFDHVTDDDLEYSTELRRQAIDFPEDGTTIKIDYVEHDDWKVSKSGSIGFRQYTWTASAKLSDMSSNVELETLPTGDPEVFTSHYMYIRLSCSLKVCFNGERTHTHGDSHTFNESWNSRSLLIPRAIADRVQKALSHLITLSGGKDKVSEDLF
ncbi:MAG: hypothetical protein OXS28_15270 [Gammaproteobacteria bacterium]|nr:hypothetical protein [Gammaproteobacteria bacterium]